LFVACLYSLAKISGIFGIFRLFGFGFDLIAKRDAPNHWHYILSHSQADLLMFAFWAVVVLIFGICGRRLHFSLLILLSPFAFITAVLALEIGLRLRGMDVYWDLWH
jgi:hypothetical protein